MVATVLVGRDRQQKALLTPAVPGAIAAPPLDFVATSEFPDDPGPGVSSLFDADDNLPNRRLFDDFDSRVALAKVIRRHRPRLVIGFGGKTVMASPDHWQAMQITDAAVFYSRLSKWDEHFDGLPVHAVTNQLSFPIALHGLEMPESSGLIVADIGPTLAAKLDAIRAYQTQFPPRRRPGSSRRSRR